MPETCDLELYADSFRAIIASRGARKQATDDEISRYYSGAIDVTLAAHHLLVERAFSAAKAEDAA